MLVLWHFFKHWIKMDVNFCAVSVLCYREGVLFSAEKKAREKAEGKSHATFFPQKKIEATFCLSPNWLFPWDGIAFA